MPNGDPLDGFFYPTLTSEINILMVYREFWHKFVIVSQMSYFLACQFWWDVLTNSKGHDDNRYLV